MEGLYDLIGDLYDTTLDRSLWPDVLRKMSKFINGASSAVFWNDAAVYNGDVYFEDGGISPPYRDLYFEKYIKLNPTTTPRFFVQPEVPVATADLVPYEEFLRTRFYREWAAPQGLVDFVSLTLEKSATKAAMFGVFRHARHGVVDEEARRRMCLLGPHIRRAVLISKVIDLKCSEAEMFAQTVDNLRTPTILIDASGRIVFANVSALEFLDKGEVFQGVQGRLTASTPEARAGLRDILLASTGNDHVIGGKGIGTPLIGKNGEHYAAHVLPLTSGARGSANRAFAATAALFVHKASLETASPPVAIAEAFKLTMTELRVLFSIVEVGGVPQVADMLGVASSTVKTHLSRIYEKTGARRQVDLVKLVAGFSSPLIS